MKEELIKNIKEIQEAITETKLTEVTSDCILEQAAKLAMTDKIGKQRQRPASADSGEVKLATEKQVAYLLSLNYEGTKDPKTMTSMEISEAIKRGKEKKYGKKEYGEIQQDDYDEGGW